MDEPQMFFTSPAEVPTFPGWRLDARLPEWPFPDLDAARIVEFDVVLSDMNDDLVDHLAHAAGDSHVIAVALEPTDWRSPGPEGAWVPAFQLPIASPRTPSELYFHEPHGEVAEAMFVRTNVLLITGSTRRWAIWAQRDWEIGVLALAPDLPMPDLALPDHSHRTLPLDADLEAFRSPSGWGMPLPPELFDELRRVWQPRAAASDELLAQAIARLDDGPALARAATSMLGEGQVRLRRWGRHGPERGRGDRLHAAHTHRQPRGHR